MLFNPFKSIIGLDIGDETVKAVRIDLRRSRFIKTKMILTAFAEQRLSNESIVDGEILKPEEVLRTVKEVVSQVTGRQKTPWVICALPETKTFIKVFSIPSGIQNITYQNISTLIKNELPIPLDESYIDWQTIPSSSNNEEKKIVMGAVLKKTADAYTYLLNIAGLSPLALEVEAASIVRALVSPTTEGTHLILDVGQTNTTFIMYSEHTIQFTLSFDFSGNLLTERIKKIVSCTTEEAENIKTTYGLDYEHCKCPAKGKNTECNFKPAMDQSMDELANHIHEGISFFSEHFNSTNPIESVILSGGSSQMINFDKELSSRIHIPVVQGNPLSQLDLSPLISKESKRPFIQFTTAIGLGLRGLNFSFES